MTTFYVHNQIAVSHSAYKYIQLCLRVHSTLQALTKYKNQVCTSSTYDQPTTINTDIPNFTENHKSKINGMDSEGRVYCKRVNGISV